MNILGVDYGERKIGLSLSTEGKLATPYKTLRINSLDEAIEKLVKIIKDDHITVVIVGISGGKTAEKAKHFSELLKDKTGIELYFQNEDLTTKDAQKMSIMAGIKRSKRKKLEDAYAATLILQTYLDDKFN